jgi:ABC-type branched-subunit amino acid transport system substrate-binding protein
VLRAARPGLALAGLLALAGCQLLGPPGGPSEPERAAYREAIAKRESDPKGAARDLALFLERWPRSSLADDAALALARLEIERGDPLAALGRLRGALRAQPEGNRSDAIRYELAKLERERGDPAAGYRVASGIRLSQLSRDERERVQRLLAELAGASGDRLAQLRWIVQIHAEAPDEDARTLVESELDELVLQLDRSELFRAAEQAGTRFPAARLRLRLAELAVLANDRDAARAELDRLGRLPLTRDEAEELRTLEARLGLRTAVTRAELPPRLVDLADVTLPDPALARGTLGVVLPLTGSFAAFGEQSLQGILLAAGVFDGRAAANGEGGVRVRVRDSKSSAEGAEAAVRELASDPEVGAILGPLSVSESAAAARAADGAHVPLLSLARADRGAPPSPWAFRLGLAPELEAAELAEFAMAQLGAKRFAILYPGDTYGRTLESLFWEAVEERGGAVVAVASYDPEATDWKEPIRRLAGFVLLSDAEQRAIAERDRLRARARKLPPREARALLEEAAALTAPDGSPLPPLVDFDALFIPDSHENVVLLAPQLAFHEITGVQLLGTNGWNHPDLVRIGEPHVEGAVFTASYHREVAHPMAYEFARRFEAVYARAPDALAAAGFDATNLVLARWIAGADSRAELRQDLLGLRNQPGIAGVLSIDEAGQALRRPQLLTVEQGRIVSVQ